MHNNLDINVHHITRVEGHGNIAVNIKNGKIEKLQWQVPEAPRFFEAMVRGHSYQDIQTIVSRICGICSITHSLDPASVGDVRHPASGLANCRLAVLTVRR